MKRIIIASMLFLLIFLAACGNKEANEVNTENEEQQVKIFTTVYPLQYFAERIGGDSVRVSSIYPAGANEHTFEPTQKDMMALADADLFFYIGLGLEGFVDNAKKTLEEEHVKMVATVDAVSEDQLEEPADVHTDESQDHKNESFENHEGHDHGDVDPHIWMSPKISQSLALSIKDSLVEISPEQQATFEKNYDELIKELQTLDAGFEEMAHSATSKTFFVSHAAFGYIANTYGLEQLAIAGLNSQDEPSQKELTKLIDLAKEKNINYILFEQNVSSKLTEVIQQEIGAESLVLHNLGVLSKEDMNNKETYFTLMNKNLETLRTVLN
ncbi:metal ABC transporter solute-binding protein, Zn/Mn family [Psychrobacillus sp. NPDC096623]|uniref:metal ABC transporter solute-binding protein, Zn/Mn family n=1 Tax=Psychrobacillus sp. NPDC096623 TaxID=3364492 RepID=UPI00382D2161